MRRRSPGAVAGVTPTRRAAVARGLASPSLAVVAGGLLLLLLGLLLLQWLFTSGFYTTQVSEARFLRTRRDDWGHVTYAVGKLKQKPPEELPVYLIGGSNVREQLQTPAALEQAIREACGSEVEVHVLGSTNQHLGESLAIVENLPEGPGVVVVGVNQTRFAYPPDVVGMQVKGRELLLRSPALRRFVADEGGPNRYQVTILPGIFNYVSGWAQKNQGALRSGGLPLNRYLEHRYFQDHVWSPAEKQSRVELWAGNRGAPGGEFDQNHAYNFDLLDRLTDVAEERGLTVVYEEVPENRAIVGDAFQRNKDVYKPFLTDLAAQKGAFYADFNDRLGLVNEDFRDLTHLVETGRAKWTVGLAEALCPAVRTAAGQEAAE